MNDDRSHPEILEHNSIYYGHLLRFGKLACNYKKDGRLVLREMADVEKAVLKEVVYSLNRGIRLNPSSMQRCKRIVGYANKMNFPNTPSDYLAHNDIQPKKREKKRPPTSKEVANKYMRLRRTPGGNWVG